MNNDFLELYSVLTPKRCRNYDSLHFSELIKKQKIPYSKFETTDVIPSFPVTFLLASYNIFLVLLQHVTTPRDDSVITSEKTAEAIDHKIRD